MSINRKIVMNHDVPFQFIDISSRKKEKVKTKKNNEILLNK